MRGGNVPWNLYVGVWFVYLCIYIHVCVYEVLLLDRCWVFICRYVCMYDSTAVGY